jgi:hypothetical protein
VRAVSTSTDDPIPLGRRIRDAIAVTLLLIGVVVLLAASASIDVRLTALLCGLLAFAAGAALAADRSEN